MNRRTTKDPTRDSREATAREVWLQLNDLVLDNERRRKVSEALGISFARTRALRRVARQPMPMGELAAVLGIDPANATGVVDDLEAQGLVRRRPHPTDRRAKLVEATRKGKDKARRAEAILSTPPAGLEALGTDDLSALHRILRDVSSQTQATGSPTEKPRRRKAT